MLTVLILLCFFPSALVCQQQTVDFRYAPQGLSFSAICFPDDWEKSVVTNTGALGYDFGCGPYAVPLTEVTIGIQEFALPVRRQFLADPTVPIVTTVSETLGVAMRQQAFALVPDSFPSLGASLCSGNVRRLDGVTGAIGWASPDSTTDPSFRSAAWGTNRPVEYRVKIAPGAARRVALGLCEPYKRGPGARILRLHVEGAADREVDPLAEGARNRALVYFFDGRDTNKDGELAVEVHASTNCPDPNTYLNAFWVFPEKAQVDPEALIHGKANAQAETFMDCGRERELLAPVVRANAITARFEGRDVTPQITVRSSRPFTFDKRTGLLLTDGRPYLASHPAAVEAIRVGRDMVLTLPQGIRAVDLVVYDALAPASSSALVPDIRNELQRAITYWKGTPGLNYGRIIVPDSGIQYLLDASIRNLYQIREHVNGHLQFQPGPSVYRGLWVHDAVWSTEAALSLGDAWAARRMIELLLTFQQENGQVKVSAPNVMNRETPLTLFMAIRYALATGDRQWLLSRWPQIARGVEWLRGERQKTLDDPSSVSYGLLPPGFADGGLGGLTAEYSGVYWSLIGVRKSIEAARWLGKVEDAQAWTEFYNDLLSSFRKAAARDLRADRFGNSYLPMKIADTSTTRPPQQASWGILEATVEGVFDLAEPLVRGTLAMLDADLQEGLPVSTGWLRDGVWPFFASIQAQACLHSGNFSRATELLYAIANHASPTGTWLEEQMPRGRGMHTGGDASDASASALFINEVRDMLVLEHGDSLVALEGVPDGWLRPGARLALNDLLTRRGRLTLQLQISQDGKTATLSGIFLPSLSRSPRLRISLAGLQRQGFRSLDGSAPPETVTAEHGKHFEISLGM